MKLIIDIPEETKQAFGKAESNDLKGGYYDLGGIIGKAIQNGTPLDDVRAEIDQLPLVLLAGNYHIDKDYVMEILDRIGRK